MPLRTGPFFYASVHGGSPSQHLHSHRPVEAVAATSTPGDDAVWGFRSLMFGGDWPWGFLDCLSPRRGIRLPSVDRPLIFGAYVAVGSPFLWDEMLHLAGCLPRPFDNDDAWDCRPQPHGTRPDRSWPWTLASASLCALDAASGPTPLGRLWSCCFLCWHHLGRPGRPWTAPDENCCPTLFPRLLRHGVVNGSVSSCASSRQSLCACWQIGPPLQRHDNNARA